MVSSILSSLFIDLYRKIDLNNLTYHNSRNASLHNSLLNNIIAHRKKKPYTLYTSKDTLNIIEWVLRGQREMENDDGEFFIFGLLLFIERDMLQSCYNCWFIFLPWSSSDFFLVVHSWSHIIRHTQFWFFIFYYWF